MLSTQKKDLQNQDLPLFRYIDTICKKHIELYHFTEISTPIIENADLFRTGTNYAHDAIQDILLFVEHKNKIEEGKLCLRAYLEPLLSQHFTRQEMSNTPIKVYTSGTIFKIAQKANGLYKEQNEISMSIIGCTANLYIAQIITMIDRLLGSTLSLNNYVLSLNCIGCVHDQQAYIKRLQIFLQSAPAQELCNTCKQIENNKCMRVFACQNEKCKTILRNAPRIIDNLCEKCAQEWVEMQEQLDLLSVTYTWNTTLMPHNPYSSKIIFEFSGSQPGQRITLCTGGLYETVSHRNSPALCCSIQLDNLVLFMQPLRDKLPIKQTPALTIILPLEKEQHTLAMLLADNLQGHGICTDILLEPESTKSLLRHANNIGASYCLILGKNEQQEHKVTIKNMITGAEDNIKQAEVYAYLKR